MIHRRRGPLGSRVSTERAVMRRFWLDRFSLEEVVEMGQALFPRGTDRAAAVLTAAANGRERR